MLLLFVVLVLLSRKGTLSAHSSSETGGAAALLSLLLLLLSVPPSAPTSHLVCTRVYTAVQMICYMFLFALGLCYFELNGDLNTYCCCVISKYFQ